MWNSKRCRSLFRLIAVAATMAAASGPARACIMFVPPTLADVSYADVVVIGQIKNYRIIRDEAFRKKRLASPNLSAKDRKFYENPKTGLLPDYARFEIQVEHVLVGQASGRLSAMWDNSTFGEPDQMVSGRYLIALRRPRSASPPLRGPSATILPSPDPSTLTVLQAPCSSAFIYGAESKEALAIRKILAAQRR
jgi:hypothetical protein